MGTSQSVPVDVLNARLDKVASTAGDNVRKVTKLLAAGASPDGPFTEGRCGYRYRRGQGPHLSPLLTAMCARNNGIVKVLLEAGANVNMITENVSSTESTALTIAIGHKNETVFRLLLEHGIDANAVTNGTLQPLTQLARMSSAHSRSGKVDVYLNMMCMLLAQPGIDVNAVSCLGETALTAACDSRNAKMVEMLLAADADVTITCRNGQCPLYYALKWRHGAIIHQLLRRGAEVTPFCLEASVGTPFEFQLQQVAEAAKTTTRLAEPSLLSVVAERIRRHDHLYTVAITDNILPQELVSVLKRRSRPPSRQWVDMIDTVFST